MKRLEENGPAPGGASEPTREALQMRVRELEAENSDLRTKMDRMERDWELDRQSLEWYYSLGMPQSEEEMLEQARTGPSISDVLTECEREMGR